MVREWLAARERALARLREHARLGLVDKDIEEQLFRVNEAGDRLFTSSSCSGRVVVFVGRDFFDKRGAGVLWSTHDPRECVRALCGHAAEAAALAGGGLVAWASLHPPIVQVHARDAGVARRVVECAWGSGFARAGAWWSRQGWMVVEASGRDKLHVILPAPCESLTRLCHALARLKPRVHAFLDCIEQVNREG